MGKPVFITGYMGSGKSTTGRKLARAIGYFHFDLDEEIEKLLGKTVSAVFAEDGEDAFRKFEHSALVSLTHRKNVVISTGGGTPCFFDNMKLMKESGITIYLKMSPESLSKRLLSARVKRPLLENIAPEDLPGYIRSHLMRREDFYNQALITVKGENLDFEKLLAAIKEAL